MIVLVGESASGKSTLVDTLSIKHGLKKVICFTTRPQRAGEINGVDYYFVSKSAFNEFINDEFFAAWEGCNGWYYGIPKDSVSSSSICAISPNLVRLLKEKHKQQITSFYISVDERKRLIRMINRGDNLIECFRRFIWDQGAFQNIENEVDCIIYANDRSPDELAETIISNAGVEI